MVPDWQIILDHYQRQEDAVIDYLRRVPFQGRQKKTYSPFLFDFFLNVGSGIEQLFKYISEWDFFDDEIPNEDLRKLRHEVKRKDYIKYPNVNLNLNIYNPYLKLKEHRLLMKYPRTLIDPFENAKYSNGNWSWSDFRTYSRDKHRSIDAVKEFRIDKLIRLLGSYFTLVCLNPLPQNYEMLCHKRIMHVGSLGTFSPDMVPLRQISDDPGILREIIKNQWSPIKGAVRIVSYESKLFIFAFQFFREYHSKSNDVILF